MSDLERSLRELRVEWPATPDIASAVQGRIAAEPRRGRSTLQWRRRLAYAAAGLVALLGGGLAVSPEARSDLLEFLGLKSVKIERRAPVATPVALGSDLGLGVAVTQAAADRAAGFTAQAPSALGEPDGLFFAESPPAGGRVSYVYGEAGRPEMIVTVARAQNIPFIHKAVGPDAEVEEFEVDGEPAYFISGGRHGVAFAAPGEEAIFEEQRLAGNTLLVELGEFLVRVEGDLDRTRAVGIARSVTATPKP